MKKQVIIIGGGAAGFFCAANLDNRKCQVTIVEKQNKVLQKVKVSGGGRCNVTNDCSDPVEMIKAYPRGNRQLRQAFSRFFTVDTRKWFESRGVRLKAEKDGRVFPVSDNSLDIIHALEHEVTSKGFKVWTGASVKEVVKSGDEYHVHLENGNVLNAFCVVVACGGFSKPEQYDWIIKAGHSIVSPVPSLFTFNVPDKAIHELKGISVEQVMVKIAGTSFSTSGPILFTHWGFSGPAILKLSSYMARELADKKYDFSFMINWLPRMSQDSLRASLSKAAISHADKLVVNACPFTFSNSFWIYILHRSGIESELRWKALKGKKVNVLVEKLANDQYHAQGKTTFKEEFVTCGGIDLKEIDFKTMESRISSGLYFAGEILDIDGITGGYNFQAAWTTGYIAADAINSKD